ncbi:DUF3173 family protein [uncultured Streptococcus sp.]|uniref:DUF3173 family protein n=1 Tax=uncultured Streptococcus sp. TaxID=83427 RepID=UPI002666EB04|nr:DUF3173 family protein [uncultured Streptococcus sp.]
MINIVDKKDIMVLTGYSESQASSLIRKAKQKLVQEGFDWYKNKRIGRVPIKTIEAILGFQLQMKNAIIDGDLQNAVIIEGEQNT